MTTSRRTMDATNNISSTPKEIYRTAVAYVESGLSLIPIRADATKMPAIELLPRVWDEEAGRYRRPWSGYRKKPPLRDELRAWFRSGGIYGLAILGGLVSNKLEILDLDNWDIVAPWMKKVRRRAPILLDKLVQVKTPRPGLHVYYRCEAADGNQKLARIPLLDPETGKIKPKTIIEIKGEGGYCLAPPSPSACHPSGRCYTVIGKRDLTEIPTILPAEREVLLDCARALNCWQPPRGEYQRRPWKHGRFLRPGDDFDARADWADILRPHGWSWHGPGGDGSDRWCRPGKSSGTSATTNFADSDWLFVFSNNADPFEQDTAYTKFGAYTLLEHDGDFHAAAQALRAQGYGARDKMRSSRAAAPFERYAGYALRPRPQT